MYSTAEIRWFFPGLIPSEVHEWFISAAAPIDASEKRTDKYLMLPDSATIGVKIRRCRLEIKVRSFEYGEVQLHPDVSGRMERWRKWSVGLDQEDEGLGDILSRGSGWVDVSKERMLARFAVEDKINVRPIGIDDDARSGCDVELTAVEAWGRQWWTVAFESFGEEHILGHNLARVAERIFAAGKPPILSLSHSCSYPQWLQEAGRHYAVVSASP
jgi:hypothetical protein